jgi:hypothetical protein
MQEVNFLDDHWAQSFTLTGSKRHDIPTSDMTSQTLRALTPDTSPDEQEHRREENRSSTAGKSPGHGNEVTNTHEQCRVSHEIVGSGFLSRIRCLNRGEDRSHSRGKDDSCAAVGRDEN